MESSCLQLGRGEAITSSSSVQSPSISLGSTFCSADLCLGVIFQQLESLFFLAKLCTFHRSIQHVAFLLGTEDSFCRILQEVSSSLSLQMNSVQAQCSLGCRKMPGAGKSCHRGHPVLLLLLPLSKQSLGLVEHTTPNMCLAQMQALCSLLRMAVFSLLSLSLAVLKWSTFPTTSMEHTCSSSHLSPREAGCGHGISVLRSHSFASSWALEGVFPTSPNGWKSKNHSTLMIIKYSFLILWE